MNRFYWGYGLFLFLLAANVLAEKQTIAPTDSRIIYHGRMEFDSQNNAGSDWPGWSIQARFSGSEISFTLQTADNWFSVDIDGEENRIIQPQGGEQSITISGLSSTEHTILIGKRSEGYAGFAKFSGFQLPENTEFLEPVRPNYLIEIIGDSYTVGYGADASGISCSNRAPLDNAIDAFGPVACRTLNASWSLVAYSGRGIVHNLSDSKQLSDHTLLDYYEQKRINDKNSRWDFSQWDPKIVVIAAGGNDLNTSQATYATKEQYQQGYVTLIEKIRTNSPQAQIVCFANWQSPGLVEYTRQVYEQQRAQGHTDIYYGQWPRIEQSAMGCDWHPNTKAQRQIADSLLAAIQRIDFPTGSRAHPAALPTERSGMAFPSAVPQGTFNLQGRIVADLNTFKQKSLFLIEKQAPVQKGY